MRVTGSIGGQIWLHSLLNDIYPVTRFYLGQPGIRDQLFFCSVWNQQYISIGNGIHDHISGRRVCESHYAITLPRQSVSQWPSSRHWVYQASGASTNIFIDQSVLFGWYVQYAVGRLHFPQDVSSGTRFKLGRPAISRPNYVSTGPAACWTHNALTPAVRRLCQPTWRHTFILCLYFWCFVDCGYIDFLLYRRSVTFYLYIWLCWHTISYWKIPAPIDLIDR